MGSPGSSARWADIVEYEELQTDFVTTLSVSEVSGLHYRNGFVSWFIDTMANEARVAEFVVRVCDSERDVASATQVLRKFRGVLVDDVARNAMRNRERMDFYTSFCRFFNSARTTIIYDRLSYNAGPRFAKVGDTVVNTHELTVHVVSSSALEGSEKIVWGTFLATYTTVNLTEFAYEGFTVNGNLSECRSYTVDKILSANFKGVKALDGRRTTAVIDGELFLIIVPYATQALVYKKEPSTLCFYAVRTDHPSGITLGDVDMTFILHPLVITLLSRMLGAQRVSYHGMLGSETPIGLIEYYKDVVKEGKELTGLLAKAESRTRLDVYYLILLGTIFSSNSTTRGTPKGSRILSTILSSIKNTMDIPTVVRREVVTIMTKTATPRFTFKYNLETIIARCANDTEN
uniref:Uncharacterized protein n=1 Tax=viral metagenome TaxID=1070528 RepID=A0A2V0RB09_9ZZZZ